MREMDRERERKRLGATGDGERKDTAGDGERKDTNQW